MPAAERTGIDGKGAAARIDMSVAFAYKQAGAADDLQAAFCASLLCSSRMI